MTAPSPLDNKSSRDQQNFLRQQNVLAPAKLLGTSKTSWHQQNFVRPAKSGAGGTHRYRLVGFPHVGSATSPSLSPGVFEVFLADSALKRTFTDTFGSPQPQRRTMRCPGDRVRGGGGPLETTRRSRRLSSFCLHRGPKSPLLCQGKQILKTAFWNSCVFTALGLLGELPS